MWATLGLAAPDITLYKRLLGDSRGDPTSLADELGIPLSDLHDSLARLDGLGLVLVRSDHVLVQHPSVTLEALIRRRRRALDDVQGLAPLLDRLYDVGRAEATTDGLVEVVRGGPEILGRLRGLLGRTRESLHLIDSPPYVSTPDPVLHDEETAAADRGVEIRTLVDFSAVDVPDHLSDLIRSVGEGQQVRLAHDVHPKMIISDARRALIPLAIDPAVGRPQVAVISHPELVAPLVRLFDTMFAAAFPLSEVLGSIESNRAVDTPPETGPHASPGASDPTLVKLLATGANDLAIARQLGISERTLRRRIVRLQDQFRAQSRFQLGVMIERSRHAAPPRG